MFFFLLWEGLPSPCFSQSAVGKIRSDVFEQKKHLVQVVMEIICKNFGAGEGKQWWDLQVHPWPSSHVVKRVVGGLWSWCQMGFEGG